MADVVGTVLAFRRGPGFVCTVNLGTDPAPLPKRPTDSR